MITQTEEFKAVRLKLASPEEILGWSYGEVTKPETINYRTQRPEKDGLFDEKIFGPIKDWECYCGKYKRIRYKGIICDKCGVEVTRAAVRRERMGYIKLAAPVTHIWFLRGVPSRLGLILDLSVQELEKVVYFAAYIIVSVDEDARAMTLEQIEREFKNKKKEIDTRYELLLGQTKQQYKETDETVRVREMWAHELEHLSSVRELARAELKSVKKYQIISELEYRDLSLKYGPVFSAGIGAAAIKQLVEEIDLEKLFTQLREQLASAEGVMKRKLIKRLKLVRSMIAATLRPEWMIITNLPVIPPDLRPMVQLDGGRFAASDLNDLYRRVINRNNRLKKLLEIGAPEVITRNEKRMLQEAVDALIDNSIRHGKEVTASTGQKRKLRSLADMLKGKQGRFRQNLLGKRVDYSGRSVIVGGPHLKLHQCGLPKKMALELFKPFVIAKLIGREYAHNVRSANRLIEQGVTVVYDILEEVTKGHYVLLNRAPTLHRLGFQAFLPVLIEGKAIQIHPLVCPAFNADFDGDQMAVHVSLTTAAQEEARNIMLSSKNLLKPASGEPIMGPNQDMVLGCYWLTRIKPGDKGESKAFGSPSEAILAYQSGVVSLKAKIRVRLNKDWGVLGMVETCVGRILFNQVLPQPMRFSNETMDKKRLQQSVAICYRDFGIERTAKLLDDIKDIGFYYVTRSGLSWGMDDLKVPAIKERLLREADEEVLSTFTQYQQGLLTAAERYNRVIEIWAEVRDKITEAITNTLDEYGTVYQMVNSGARGSVSQIAQMAGMKGLVTNPAGEVIELPARDSFKEGLNILEYFIATHGSRKGMTDTALRTADAGYLTRRLVDVAQDIVINAQDCTTKDFRIITKASSEALGRSLGRRVFGRMLAGDLVDGGKVIANRGDFVDDRGSEKIDKSGVEEVKVRSVLRCTLPRGICAACYGYDLGYNKQVELGAAVGIVAAQAIGEPGTQLTMRTFHTGGIAGLDITQGLPRVEELLEAREPKGQAAISEIDGWVATIKTSAKESVIRLEAKEVAEDEYQLETPKLQLKEDETVSAGDPLFVSRKGETVKAKASGRVKIEKDRLVVVREAENFKEYSVPAGLGVIVKEGDLISKGQPLTEGNLNLHQLFYLKGIEACQDYIISEVQEIYASQGQNVNEKHIEIIVRQMFSKVRVTDPGDTDLLMGDLVDKSRLNLENKKIPAHGKMAVAEQLLLGITKASLNTESFLAAASFQETTRVLIEAAITAKTDYLRGLKENVIIGKLIPAGTGYVSSALEEKEAAEVEAGAKVTLK